MTLLEPGGNAMPQPSPPPTADGVDFSPVPPGASLGLVAVIEDAQTAIRLSRDALGQGRPDMAPDLIQLLQTNGFIDPQSHGLTVDRYESHVAQLNTINAGMQDSHTNVLGSTVGVGDIVVQTCAQIDLRVSQLKQVIVAAGPRKPLSPTTEQALLDAFLTGVGEVHDDVAGAETQICECRDLIAGQDKAGLMLARRLNNGPSTLAELEFADSNLPPDGKLTDGQVSSFISQALDSLSIINPVARFRWTAGYLHLTDNESTDNYKAVNNWDSNALAGHPSTGLTQTIQKTFDKFHVPGTANSMTDPVASIAASMDYAMEDYNVKPDGSNLAANIQQADPNATTAKGY
ncbi:hypothetical protein [Nocardia sp. NBC_01327]|uniref:hypothetical protein n=1 Tax=Nocardia sp. NBC_01327 TaxID=2903593 RepID=UPI002E12630B|nr:hypothetical protein OG326_42905 [Nocardia sp. NBC_01327]